MVVGDTHQTCLSAHGDDPMDRETGPTGVRVWNCMMRQEGLEGRTRGGELLSVEARALLSQCKRVGAECGSQCR